MSRKVSVFSTSTGKLVPIETDARTWGDLRKILEEKGISFSGMKAIVKETEMALEGDNAALPEGEFKLFLTPSKVKSGN